MAVSDKYTTYSRNTRYDYQRDSLKRINHLEGIYVECGCGSGRFVKKIIQSMDAREIVRRELHLFDSFKGLPELTKEDERIGPLPQKGDLAFPLRVFQSFQKKYNSLNPDAIKQNKLMYVYPGFCEDTLPVFVEDVLSKFEAKPIAILHIDADIYGSYKTSLETLYDQVITGGIIMFDEYKSDSQLKKWPGAAIAIDEFFENKGIDIQFERWNMINQRDKSKISMSKFCMIKQ